MKNKVGILVDRRSIELSCIAEFSSQYHVKVFSSNKELFQSVLADELDLIILDSELLSENPAMVERYSMVNPELIILVLGECNEQLTKYKEVGCTLYIHPLSIGAEIQNLGAPQKSSPVKPAANLLDVRWRLSKNDYHLYTPEAIKIKLTPREYKLLELLFNNNKVVNKDDINRLIIGLNIDTSDQRIAVMITRLRKKVLTHSSSLIPIVSDYSNGYVFTGPHYID